MYVINFAAERMPERVADEVQRRVTVDGHAVTTDGVERMLRDSSATLISRLASLEQAINNNSGNSSSSSNSSSACPAQGDYRCYMYDGMYHGVPKGFRLPISMNLKDGWQLWHFGKDSGEAPTAWCPLKHVKPKYDLNTAADKTAYSRLRKVMQQLMSECDDGNAKSTTIDTANSDAVYNVTLNPNPKPCDQR